jgi:opacity protein-like surface antigen
LNQGKTEESEMLKHALTALATGLLFCAAPTLAADRGFYMGAGAGLATLEVDDVLDLGVDFDEDDVGFKLFGGYRFFPWLGVEGAYFNGGKPEVSESDGTLSASMEIGVQGLIAAAVFSLPVGERFELFIKPGVAFWDAETTIRVRDQSGSFGGSVDDNGSAFFLGGGAAFNFSESLAARLEYEWFEAAPEWDSGSDEFVTEVDATAGFLSVSLVYTF